MTIAFKVLEKKEKIHGNFFLEASAGTGKTFTIAHLILRLIVDESCPLEIAKVAAVTFTKAAASELKERIKNLLVEAKKKLEAGQPLTFQDENTCLKSALSKINFALADFDAASITTLHGLSYKLLQKHALALGCDLNLKNVEEEAQELWVYDLIKDNLLGRTFSESLHHMQKVNWLNHYRGDMHQAILALRQKLISGLQFEHTSSWPESKTKILSAAKNLTSIPDKNSLSEFIENFKLSPITKDEAESELNDFLEALQDHNKIHKLLVKKSLFDFCLPEKLKAKVKAPLNSEVTAFVYDIQKKLRPIVQECLSWARIELFILKTLEPLYQKKLDDLNILSFQGMLEKLDQKLVSSEIIQLINKDFDAVIIDEFQDTDPLQWSICKKLFIDHPVKAFYMVGDPKQAIYAFRAADVYTYLDVKKNCPNLQIRSLDTCYRSSFKFIEGLNGFLTKTSWLNLPYLNETLSYSQVSSAAEENSETEVPFHFYHTERTLEDLELDMAHLAIKLKQQDPTGSIAILVKDRFQLERIEQHLKQKSVSAQTIKNEQLDHSVIFELHLALLQILQHNLTFGVINSLLVSPWVNFTLEDFRKETFKELHYLFNQLLTELKNIFNQSDYLTFLEHFFDTKIPGQNISFREKIVSFFGCDIQSKLIYVAVHMQNGAKLNDARLLQLELEKLKKQAFKIPSSQDQTASICLMTSHMSKGLEFDHVIAMGIATRQSTSSEMILKKMGDKTILGINIFDETSQLALEELDAEKMRQMYVAITRAKKTVHLPMVNYSGEKIFSGGLAPLELFILKILYPTHRFLDLYGCAQSVNWKEEITKIFHESSFIHHTAIETSASEPEAISLSYLDKSKPIANIIQDQTLSFTQLKTESTFTFVEDELKGRDYGDFFHMLIEDLITSRKYLDFDSESTQSYLNMLIGASPFKDHKEIIISHLNNALEYPFKTKEGSFSLKNIAPENLYVESQFSYKTDEGIMKGFIDLVVIYNEEIIFIDWKTSRLKDSSEESILEHMKQASYLLQLEIYTKALKNLESYFSPRKLTTAFYMFVKQNAVYAADLETQRCLI